MHADQKQRRAQETDTVSNVSAWASGGPVAKDPPADAGTLGLTPWPGKIQWPRVQACGPNY